MTIETKKLVISEELKRKIEMICKFAYKERDEIRKIFQIILLVYTELLKKLLKQDNKFNELKLEFLEKLNVIEVNNRINMLIEFIDNLETNANVELLLDRFVIELGEENE